MRSLIAQDFVSVALLLWRLYRGVDEVLNEAIS